MNNIEERINNDFTYHAPDAASIAAMRELREKAKSLALLIAGTVPAGREQSLAITNLEQVVMWANAGIARKHPTTD